MNTSILSLYGQTSATSASCVMTMEIGALGIWYMYLWALMLLSKYSNVLSESCSEFEMPLALNTASYFDHGLSIIKFISNAYFTMILLRIAKIHG